MFFLRCSSAADFKTKMPFDGRRNLPQQRRSPPTCQYWVPHTISILKQAPAVGDFQLLDIWATPGDFNKPGTRSYSQCGNTDHQVGIWYKDQSPKNRNCKTAQRFKFGFVQSISNYHSGRPPIVGRFRSERRSKTGGSGIIQLACLSIRNSESGLLTFRS